MRVGGRERARRKRKAVGVEGSRAEPGGAVAVAPPTEAVAVVAVVGSMGSGRSLVVEAVAGNRQPCRPFWSPRRRRG